jgi:Mg2+ and Co2+ transporter CorA
MSLISCLEGLTSRRSDQTQWSEIQASELGTFDSLLTYEIWTRSQSLKPLVTKREGISGTYAPQQLLSTPNDTNITGGIKVLVFNNWKDVKGGNDQEADVVKGAMACLDLPLWLPARLFTHAFFRDPSNRQAENTNPTRRYWQRFRGGLLLRSHNMTKHVTRALFLCREEQYWTAFEQNLKRCESHAALPMIAGVVAYLQQVKVSVSYIYWVREKVNGILREVDKNLTVVDKMSGKKEKTLAEEESQHQTLERVEHHIWELVRCAQEAARAVPYLTDNSGNLHRITDSLTAIKEENEAYRKVAAATKVSQARQYQAEELSGVIDDVLIELKSQILAADWISTKIDSLVQNTNLTINRADQRSNLLIADSSLTIALESKRDNLSMITIAAITMVFLPGTFVASFFAMPLLNWQAPKGTTVVSHRFWVYWAVTVPLTIGTILLWLAWFRRKDIAVKWRKSHRRAGSVPSSALLHTHQNGTVFPPPAKAPTSDYRMAPNPRIDWSNKGDTINPMRYVV